jgi:hypothetical protein
MELVWQARASWRSNRPPALKEYNDILERAHRGCVESAMYVCYE